MAGSPLSLSPPWSRHESANALSKSLSTPSGGARSGRAGPQRRGREIGAELRLGNGVEQVAVRLRHRDVFERTEHPGLVDATSDQEATATIADGVQCFDHPTFTFAVVF